MSKCCKVGCEEAPTHTVRVMGTLPQEACSKHAEEMVTLGYWWGRCTWASPITPAAREDKDE